MLKHICIFISFVFSAYVSSQPFIKVPVPDIASLQQLNVDDLCDVARSTVNYKTLDESDLAWQEKTLFPEGVTVAKVKKTLSYLCQLVADGKGEQLKERQFLIKHFDFYQWLPDKATANKLALKSTNKRKTQMLEAIPEQQIFLTKYYTKLLRGSAVKTAQYPVALYQLPYDESGLSTKQAVQRKHELTRYQFTRQQIIAGALERNNLAKPLVWLSEAALHDVLLQGTGVLDVDGKLRYFNVHRNNGITYDYTLGKTAQARYWYFAEVNGIKGYGQEISDKINLKPRVSFAGNVKQLGLGKLFLVTFKQKQLEQSQLGILADEGGAFDNNLFQMDWLVESYYGWTDYHQANKHYPDYAQVWLMIKK